MAERRNIPAHAGKTKLMVKPLRPTQEHPRARGENQCEFRHSHQAIRNIPAHAGKTCSFAFASRRGTEHTRARGENPRTASVHWSASGTSPRTRGKLMEVARKIAPDRNIPAHAGKTPGQHRSIGQPAEHPRARGENLQERMEDATMLGTSPRTRGKPHHRRG